MYCLPVRVTPTAFKWRIDGTAFDRRSPQEERYKKERSEYLRAKRKQEQDKAAAAASKRGARHGGHSAEAGMKDRSKRSRPLKRPQKPAPAMV